MFCSVKKIADGDEIMLATKNGQSIRFSEKEVRQMGRPASGIRGIKIKRETRLFKWKLLRKIKIKKISC